MVDVGVLFKVDGEDRYRDAVGCSYHFVPRMGDLLTKNGHLFVVDRVIVTDYLSEHDQWKCVIYASQTF